MRSLTRISTVGGISVLLTATGLTGAVLSSAPASAAGSTPSCQTRDLTASINTKGGGTAGSVYAQLRLRNTSNRTCRTGGFPGVAYVGDGSGTQIGAPATWVNPGQVRTLFVQPGGSVEATLREVDAHNYPPNVCRPQATDGLRVYAPNQTASLFVVQRTTGCRNPNVHLLSVTPFAAG